jgi:hypothetical protein
MDNNVSENEMPAKNVSDYLDRLEKSVGSNRDTDGLGTMAAGPFVIGSVEAINGEEGKELPEFVATKHELKQLAEYWALEGIEHDFDWFVYQSGGACTSTAASTASAKFWDRRRCKRHIKLRSHHSANETPR